MRSRSRSGRTALSTTITLGTAVVVCFVLWGILGPVIRPRETFLKVQLSPRQTVWIQFHGGQFRAASEAAQLAKAPLRPLRRDTKLPFATSPAVYLSQEVREFGNDGLYLASDVTGVHGRWRVSKDDAAGAGWRYLFSCTLEAPGDGISHPISLLLPDLRAVDMEVKATAPRPMPKRTIAIAITVMDKPFTLASATKDGQPVRVQVRVVDAKGKTVSSERENLSAGSRADDTAHSSVTVHDKGTYTVEADVDLGPLGSLHRATKVKL